MEEHFKSELLTFIGKFEKYGDEFVQLKEKFEKLQISEKNISVLVNDMTNNKETVEKLFIFKKTSLSTLWENDVPQEEKDIYNNDVAKLMEIGDVSLHMLKIKEDLKNVPEMSDEEKTNLENFSFENISEFFEKSSTEELLQHPKIQELLKKIPGGFDIKTIKPTLEDIFEEIKGSDVCKKTLERIKEKDVQDKINHFYSKSFIVIEQFLVELGLTSFDKFTVSSLNPEVLKKMIKGKEKTLGTLQQEVNELVEFIGIDKEEVSKLLKRIFNKFDKFTSKNPMISALFNGFLKQVGLGGAPKKNENKEEKKNKRRRKMRSEMRKKLRKEIAEGKRK